MTVGTSPIIYCLTESPFFLRGKGDYFRLGHGSDSHIRKPQVAESLKTRKIVDVAVGALHCLAVTDTGQVGSACTGGAFVVTVFFF